jgi:hypothetical protein
MANSDPDEAREERIKSRITVDAYSPEEAAMGWYAYLDDLLEFPFEARCVDRCEESPLTEGETVRVVDMTSTEPTLSQMSVIVEWMDRRLGVPLRQLEAVEPGEDTQQALEDWQYWLKR